MKIYRYLIKTNLKSELNLNEHYQIIGKAISGFIGIDNEIHYAHTFKNYVYSNLGYAKNKKYSIGEYLLELRSFNEDILQNKKFKYKNILNFELIKKEKIDFENFNIKYLKTFNPVVLVKNNKKYWVKNDGKEELINLIISNSIKKFKKFIGDIDNNYDFIEYIDILNNYPIKIKYKNISLLGNKFLIRFKEDETSQKIAKLLFAIGIGNKNASAGCGFSNVVNFI